MAVTKMEEGVQFLASKDNSIESGDSIVHVDIYLNLRG